MILKQVILINNLRGTKICILSLPKLIEHNILWLDIPMHNAMLMQIVQSKNAISHYPLNIRLIELFLVFETSFKLEFFEVPTHDLSKLGVVNDQEKLVLFL